MVKEGGTVIDVGISKSSIGRAVMKKKPFLGDVDFDGTLMTEIVSV